MMPSFTISRKSHLRHRQSRWSWCHHLQSQERVIYDTDKAGGHDAFIYNLKKELFMTQTMQVVMMPSFTISRKSHLRHRQSRWSWCHHLQSQERVTYDPDKIDDHVALIYNHMENVLTTHSK